MPSRIDTARGEFDLTGRLWQEAAKQREQDRKHELSGRPHLDDDSNRDRCGSCQGYYDECGCP
jgi:hypothetical protein